MNNKEARTLGEQVCDEKISEEEFLSILDEKKLSRAEFNKLLAKAELIYTGKVLGVIFVSLVSLAVIMQFLVWEFAKK